MIESGDCDPLSKKFEEEDSLSRTIKTVLTFPEKVTRPAELPLSKVAFIEGDFIHTNEFIVANGESDDNLEDNSLSSHTETADILQKRLITVRAEIAKLQRSKEEKRKKNPVSFLESDKGNDQPTSFLEIREFLDEEGNEVNAQVVNMSEEMKDVGGLMEKLGMEENRGKDKDNSGRKDPKKAKAFQALGEKMKSLEDAQKHMGQESEDPETRFAYEIRATPTVQAPSSASLNLDFLDDLVQQEAADEARKNELRTVEESSFGSGFKSGFLGGGNEGKGKRSSPKKKSVGTTAKQATAAGEGGEKDKQKRPVAFGQVVLEKNI